MPEPLRFPPFTRTEPKCAWCHHDRENHLHYRAGTDCGVCGCRVYSHPSLWPRPWKKKTT